MLLGGTSEIGLAILLELARGGLRAAVLAGRDAPGLDRAAGLLREAGLTAVHTVALDAADSAAELAAAVRTGDELLGGADVICLALGRLDPPGPLTPEAVADVMQVGLLAPAILASAAADLLAARSGGHLVVLSSLTATAPRPALLAYGAAKAGLDAFALGLGDRLRASGASVLVVRPAQVRTRMSAHLPDRPLTVDPVDVARAVARGLREGRRIVWVPLAGRAAAGVLARLPRAVLRRLPA